MAARTPQFHYRFFAFGGGQPSEDTAPAAAFPADWRRLDLDEAIAVAGPTIFVPRRLLSRDDTELTAILAHAMGHIVLRYPTVGMTRAELAQVEMQAARLLQDAGFDPATLLTYLRTLRAPQNNDVAVYPPQNGSRPFRRSLSSWAGDGCGKRSNIN